MNDVPDQAASPDFPKKAPRKPRPSEIAAKKVKAAAAKKKKPAAKKVRSRAPTKKAVKTKKPAKKTATAKKPRGSKRKFKMAGAKKQHKAAVKKAKRKAKGNTRPLARTARIDVKLLPKHKNKVFAAARKRGIPATTVLQELIEKMK